MTLELKNRKIGWGIMAVTMLAMWPPTTQAVQGQEVRTPRLVLKGHKDGFPSDGLSFSPDGLTLASAGIDRTVRLWDVASGRERLCFHGHEGAVFAVSFAPDGKTVASGGADRTIRIWNAPDGQERAILLTRWTVFGLAYSHDGRRLASCGGDIRLWDPDNRHLVATLQVNTPAGPTQEVAFTPDGKTLASFEMDGTLIRLWDIPTGRERATLKGHRCGIEQIAISPDGRWLASAGGADLTARIWYLPTGAERHALKGHKGRVSAVAFTPDGKAVATASSEETSIRLWDVTTGHQQMTLASHPCRIDTFAISPDGKTLAAGDHQSTILLWDLAQEINHFE